MSSKQKCETLAKALERVADKLREPMGRKIWDEIEPTMQSLIAQVHLFLKKEIELTSEELPASKKSKLKELKDDDKDNQILNDWPDIIL